MESKKVKVEQLIRDAVLVINDGYRAKNSELVANGTVPFARVSNVNNGFHFDNADYFPEADLSKVGNKLSQALDVVFTSKGTVGRFALVGEDTRAFVYSPQLCFWRSLRPEFLAPKWLFYWMQGEDFYEQYKGVSSQTDMAEYVSLQDQRKMTISVPPPNTQKAIAQTLGTLDDKIELLRQTNETLEAMARALFKSWFVDFDPVRKKSEGLPTGLPKEIDDLFPSEFEDSELGEIPKGWTVELLGDSFDIKMGQAPEGSTYNEVGVGMPLYQGRTDFGFRFPVRRMFTSSPTRVAEVGDTLISVRAPVGDQNLADEPCCMGRGVGAIRHKSGAKYYTYHRVHYLQDDLSVFDGEGTVFGSVNKKDLSSIKIVTPPADLVAAFERNVQPFDDSIENHCRTLLSLEGTRDSLLPKLISGDLELTEEMITKILEPAK